MYGAVRLLFFYADQGFQPSGQSSVTCRSGADCTYQRYLADPASARELRAAGVTDAATFERYFLGQQLDGAVTLVVWTAAPAVLGGVMYAATRPRPQTAGGIPAGQAE
jgi:hypothetical protein